MSNIRPTDGSSHQIVPNTPIDTLLYALPPYIIQFLLSKLVKMIKVDIWEDGEDVNKGNHILMECIMALLRPVQGIDNLYRLIDTTFYGTEYNAVSDEDTGIITYIPEIPVVPPQNIYPIVQATKRIRQTLNLAVVGDISDDLTETQPSIHADLQAIYDKINSGDTDLTTILDDLALIIAAL